MKMPVVMQKKRIKISRHDPPKEKNNRVRRAFGV